MTDEEKSCVEKMIKAEKEFSKKLLTTRVLVPAVGISLMANAAYHRKWLRFGLLIPATVLVKTICGYYVMYSFAAHMRS